MALLNKHRRAASFVGSPISLGRTVYDGVLDEDYDVALSPRSRRRRSPRRVVSPRRRVGSPGSRNFSSRVVDDLDYDLEYDFDHDQDYSPRRSRLVTSPSRRRAVLARDELYHAPARPVPLLAGQTFLVPDNTASALLVGLWNAGGRRHHSNAPNLDVSLIQYDYNGRFVEGGVVDSGHTRTEWESERLGRWVTTAEYLDDEIDGRHDIRVNLDTVATNVQSLFFVMSAPTGSMHAEHAPGVSMVAADDYGGEITLASYDPDMNRLETVEGGVRHATSVVMCRLWRAAPEESASYTVWRSGVPVQEGEWVFEAIGLSSYGRGGLYPRYGPITDTIESWLWGHDTTTAAVGGRRLVRYGAGHDPRRYRRSGSSPVFSSSDIPACLYCE